MYSLKHDFRNDIQDYLKNGLKDSATSIKLISATQTLFCNKLLLQMASPVLRTLIENDSVIFFPDFDSKILNCFIKIVLNGKAFLNFESEKNELSQLTEILQIQNFEVDNDESPPKVTDEPQYTTTFKVKNEYTCKYCLDIFSTKQARINHENEIHEKEMIQCEQYPKKFKSKIGLKTHVKNKHEKNIHYVCQTCAKVFKNNSDLKRHCRTENHDYSEIYTEIPDKSETCDICFKIVINLHKHKETYHSKNNNNEKKELKCDHCDFKTKRKDSLLRHERCVHDMYDKSFDNIDNTFDNLSDMEWQCKK